jgi:hypothetical protein
MSLEEIVSFVPGELVVKARGASKGRIGIVLSVTTNTSGNTLVKVLSESKIKDWYVDYVELI